MLYVRTLARGLLNGDSAEFQVITYTLGMGHPTGYPVYVLVGKLFTFLPIGEIAYRVNFFSAFSAAIAIALVYLIIRQLGASYASAIFGALMLAFNPLFWKFASMAEVYAPAAACLAFILFCVLKWKAANQSVWIILAGIAGGLSLGIHSEIALATAPAIALYLVLQKKSAVIKPAALGAIVGVGLFLVAFLYIDQRDSPLSYYNTVVIPSLSAWNMTPADFDSPLERLAYLYFPPQFKGKFFAVSADVVFLRLGDFVGAYKLLLTCGALGVVSFFLPNRKPAAWKEAALLFLVLSVSAAFAVGYDVYDYYVFYYPSFMALAIFSGVGANWMMESIAVYIKSPRLAAWGFGLILVAVLTTAFYSDAVTAWRARIPPALNESDLYSFQFPAVYKFKAEKTVAFLEDNAIVFTKWSALHSLSYTAVVAHGRRDINFHQIYLQEGKSQIADSVIDYIEANIDRRPIYFTTYPSALADRYSITTVAADLFRIEKK